MRDKARFHENNLNPIFAQSPWYFDGCLARSLLLRINPRLKALYALTGWVGNKQQKTYAKMLAEPAQSAILYVRQHLSRVIQKRTRVARNVR
mmetsp:Transcript_5077/g.7056  ORF Transcript_5077/g.7056 Transcript_5077/m.7056 type:complete len:92 (+) Transcript_5077:286-561(+)